MPTKAKRSPTAARAGRRARRTSADPALLALKRQVAGAVRQQIQVRRTNISDLARQIGTSRTAIRRILDPLNTSFTANTLFRALRALGIRIDVHVTPLRTEELMTLARKMVDAPTTREADKLEAEFLDGFYGAPAPAHAPGPTRQPSSRADAAPAAARA